MPETLIDIWLLEMCQNHPLMAMVLLIGILYTIYTILEIAYLIANRY